MRYRFVPAMLLGTFAVTGCGAARPGEASNAATADEEVLTAAADPVVPAACQAFQSESIDPLRRWAAAFPVERGGFVLTFTGPDAEPMEAEAVMEMRGIAGYEAVGCGTAVVLWIPGIEDEAQALELAAAVQDGSSLAHFGSDCFRLDEVRPRLARECESGSLPEEICNR